jgi:alpha-mannosidase
MSSTKSSRREVLKAAATAAVVAASPAEGQQATTRPTTAPTRAFYYVDGFHSGIDGHMPPDSLRNVLDGLDRFPEWKVSFEIEPYSWAKFVESDPQSIDRLRRYLAERGPAGRVEMVSGAYGQGYAWNGGGESNIRQIAYGLAELRAVFPGLVVDTHAVQEPCWTSCLPQILKSFGYRRAVLKNSTCWGGYHGPTHDTDLIEWVGPDDTAIIAVPQYPLERPVPPATTESARPPAGFLERCAAAGIEHPAGTTLQDMGWPGRPWRFGIASDVARAMRNVTWRQYVETIASPAPKRWNASQDDLRVSLPWGGSILQRIAQLVRASEHRLVQAEKLASMAFVRRGTAFPRDGLKAAWKHLLWSQHHDVWIVSYNRHKDGTWASAVEAKAQVIERTCDQVIAESVGALAKRPEAQEHGQCVRVFNTTGFRRRDLASIDIAAGERLRVLDARGAEFPSQVIANTLVFPADVPAVGYATYRLAASQGRQWPEKDGPAKSMTMADGSVILETDLFSIAIDPARGGRIRSLFAKDLDREFVDESSRRSFNEFRGYFGSEQKWLSSVDAPAEVRIAEQGPLRVAAEIRARIGAWPFVTLVSAAAGRRRIDFSTTFELPVDPQPKRFRVGEPSEAGRAAKSSIRRPFYDSSFKLQALFPVKLRRPMTLDKSAPFDVCRSTVTDTRYNAWDSIKNDVIFGWVDVAEEGGAAGLAVMSDHLTAYTLWPDEPLGLVMCYAGPGIWHDYGLGRVPSVSYAVVPHAGDWAKAQLWREFARWGEPLVAERCAAPPEDDSAWSLLDASEGGFEVVTAFVEDGDVIVRLFNAEGHAMARPIVLDGRVRRVHVVELDGRMVEELPITRDGRGVNSARLAMSRFAVRTVRARWGKGYRRKCRKSLENYLAGAKMPLPRWIGTMRRRAQPES